MNNGINLNADSIGLEFAPSELQRHDKMALNQDALNSLRIEREPELQAASPRRTPLIIAVVVIVVLGLAGWGLFAGNAAIEVEAVQATATHGTAGGSSVLDASGFVVARRLATVSAKLTGQVEQVFIEEGDHVKQGQVLARLDGSTVLKQLDLSKQQLEATHSQLAEVKVRLTDAQRAAKRAEQLRTEKLISEAESDTAQTNAAALQAQLSALQAQVAVAEANVRVQQQYASDLEIRAPFTGVILSKDAQPGEIISPMSAGGGFTRTGIATIVDMDSREIEVDVNESFIHRVTENQKAEAVLDAYPDWDIPGHVISIVPTADRAKATVKVRIAFDKLDPRILPDMGVKVRFLDNAETTASNAITAGVDLPSTAIFSEGEHHYVWRIVDNKVERIAVNAGEEHNGRIQINSGISAGDEIVATAVAQLHDGAKIKIKQ